MADIILLDDQIDALDWMSAALDALGHTVRRFSSAARAIAALDERSPDLVVCDIFMPEMDGLAFARMARTYGGVPIMFVSIARLRADAVLAGAVGWVKKPATAAEIRSAVERALGPRASAKVLVTDDDDDTRELYRAFLEPRFEVVAAHDGREALSLLDAGGIDLLVADVHMPVMNGVELVRAVREDPRYDELPIVVQSSDLAALRAPVWRELCVDARIEKAQFLDWLDGRIADHVPRPSERTAPGPFGRR